MPEKFFIYLKISKLIFFYLISWISGPTIWLFLTYACCLFKEFFISGGDGLPRGVVENQVARVRQVVKLHGYEVSSATTMKY